MVIDYFVDLQGLVSLLYAEIIQWLPTSYLIFWLACPLEYNADSMLLYIYKLLLIIILI